MIMDAKECISKSDLERDVVISDTLVVESSFKQALERLRWKIDLHIYPILFVLQIFSFLDRINIGNARIQGLTEELELYGNRYNIVLFVYFIPYILLEIPSNIFIKKTRPSLYLSGLMFSWGIVNMSMGFVKSFAQLVVLRTLLGVLEAGVLPGIIYLTSMFYKRHDFQARMTIIFFGSVFAGAIGGFLAYTIAELDGHCNLRAWRWIFIIEGAATVAVSLIAVFLIVDWPSQCQFLSIQEKALLNRILAEDGTAEARMDTLNKQAFRLIFSDWKIWLGALIFFGTGVTAYCLSFFMPTILVEFGWNAREAQVQSIPVYAVASAFMFSVAWLSDRYRHRYGFVMLCCVLTTIGFVLQLCQESPSRDAGYVSLFLLAMGGYTLPPLSVSWLANNLSGHWKRAFGAGIQVTLGGVSGVLATNIFIEHEAPRYLTGYGTALALNWLGGVAATVLFAGMLRENKKRRSGDRDHRLNGPVEEVRNMGDYHPSFRFTL
ncbi:MFS general substrate transporter [Xylaria curta]|nr:MFS general substrate transporter [Xylaria curta]